MLTFSASGKENALSVPNPHWMRGANAKRKRMEPPVANGGVHAGCKQCQRNCPQVCKVAASVDWALSVEASQQNVANYLFRDTWW